MLNFGASIGPLIKSLCLAKFKYFALYMSDPGFYDPPFHDPLCDFLQYEQVKDKLIVMSRGHLKTHVASTLYPLWLALKDPSIRCLIVKNNEPNARETVHGIRGMVESDKFQLLFPEMVPNPQHTRWSDLSACLPRPHDYPEATFSAAGMGTSVVGKHYNLIIEDDTVFVKKDQLTGDEIFPNPDDIEKAIGFHRLTVPLLISPKTDKRVVIGTRWAEDDLIHHIETEEKAHFKIMDIPTIDEDTGKPHYCRFDLDVLASIKSSMTNWLFSLLYLNKPLGASDRYFREGDTLFWDEVPLPEDGYIRITVDPADPPTGKTDQCYTGIVVAKDTSSGLYVMETRFGRYTLMQMIGHTLNLADKHAASEIRIEADRYPHLEHAFRQEMELRDKYYRIDPVKTKGRSKDARIMRVAGVHEAGTIYFLKNQEELLSQMYQFPRSTKKDLVDALAWHILDNKKLFQHEHPKVKASPKDYRVFTLEEIEASFQRDYGSGGYKELFDKQLAVG